MKRKQLIAYFEKEWMDTDKALRNYVQKGEPKQLHKFRVQVKKLRAFIILAENIVEPPKLGRPFKPVKKIFKRAGIIRDGQILLELGRSQHAPAAFIEEQLQQIKNAEQDFGSNPRRHFARLKAARRKIKQRLRPLNDLHLHFFYEQELQAIASQLAGPVSDEDLHNCRKRLKVLLYNFRLARPVLRLPFNETYVDELQDTIGNWHDNLLAGLIFPKLQKKDGALRKNIGLLSNDFYNRATITTDPALKQID